METDRFNPALIRAPVDPLARDPGAPLLRLANVPNLLTVSRITMLAPLCYFSYAVEPKTFGFLLMIFWATDLLDGASARFLGVSSSFGAELDAIADSVGGFVVTLCLWSLFPQAFSEIIPYLIFAGLLGLAYIGLSLYKIRRIGLHFWSAKLMGFATFVFQVHTALVGFDRGLFFAWLFAFTLAMVEQMLAMVLGTPTYRTKTVFEVL